MFVQNCIIPICFVSIEMFIQRGHMLVWIVLTISFLQQLIINPFKIIPESYMVVKATGSQKNRIIKYANLVLLGFLNVSYIVSSLILVALGRASLYETAVMSLIFNIELIFLFSVGDFMRIFNGKGLERVKFFGWINNVLLQIILLISLALNYLISHFFKYPIIVLFIVLLMVIYLFRIRFQYNKAINCH